MKNLLIIGFIFISCLTYGQHKKDSVCFKMMADTSRPPSGILRPIWYVSVTDTTIKQGVAYKTRRIRVLTPKEVKKLGK